MPDYEFQETFSVNKVREFCALSKCDLLNSEKLFY